MLVTKCYLNVSLISLQSFNALMLGTSHRRSKISFRMLRRLEKGNSWNHGGWVSVMASVRALNKDDKILSPGCVTLGKSIYLQESQLLHL